MQPRELWMAWALAGATMVLRSVVVHRLPSGYTIVPCELTLVIPAQDTLVSVPGQTVGVSHLVENTEDPPAVPEEIAKRDAPPAVVAWSLVDCPPGKHLFTT